MAEQKNSEKPDTPSNLLMELAKKKAQAQKEAHAFGRFAKRNTRAGDAAKPAFYGGRNGQGKPC